LPHFVTPYSNCSLPGFSLSQCMPSLYFMTSLFHRFPPICRAPKYWPRSVDSPPLPLGEKVPFFPAELPAPCETRHRGIVSVVAFQPASIFFPPPPRATAREGTLSSFAILRSEGLFLQRFHAQGTPLFSSLLLIKRWRKCDCFNEDIDAPPRLRRSFFSFPP